MLFGPILGRELLTMPRKPRGHGSRVGVALLMGGALAANYYGFREYYENGGHFTLSQLSIYARSTFFSLAALQLTLTLTIVPGLVSPAIAEEKERKTLHYLLTSRLGSGEIVLGKLAARMLQYLVSVTAGVPIFLMLTMLGGFQPEWVLALYLMTLAMAYFLGGMSIFASTISKRTKQASNLAGLFAGTWFLAPIVLWIFRLARLIPRPFQPAVDFLQTWLFDVSPTSFLANFSAIMGRTSASSIYDRAWGMIGLQIVYGTLFILLAILLLRPAYRRQDNPPRRIIDRLRGVRTVARKHPGIGEWPVLWKECFTAPPAGVGRFLGYLIAIFFLSALCIGLFKLVEPLVASRIGTAPMSPVWLEHRLTQVNATIRYLTAIIYGFTAILVAGGAATMISTERERDTWDALIVTPLEPKQIILQKMLGAIYQQRKMMVPIAIIWLTALGTGGLSIFAALIVLAEFAIFFGFAAAVGLWSSLFAKGTSNASSWAGGILLLLNLVGVLTAWALKIDSIWFWTLCSPSTVLFSLFRGSSAVTPTELGFTVVAGNIDLFLSCAVGLATYVVLAFCFAGDAIRRFDQAVGRPRRMIGPFEAREPTPKAEPLVKTASSGA